MNSSSLITLFTPLPRSRTRPSSFMVSVVMHALVLGLVVLSITNAPRIREQTLTQRYTVRIIKLHGTEPQLHWSPGAGAPHPATQAAMHAAPGGGRPVAAAVPQQLARRIPAPMTLVQPEVKLDAVLPLQAKVPLVVMWVPANMPAARIVPPLPQKTAPAKVRPTLSAPNHELIAADLKLSASTFVTATLPVTASTTSPIALPRSQMPQAPQTASNSSAHPTPATVMSVSDVLVSTGAIALPPANQTAAASPSDSFAPGRQESTATNGEGTIAGKQNGNGAGKNPGGEGNQETARNGLAGQKGAISGAGSGTDIGSLSGNEPTITRIALPRNGTFGVVVVGSSLTEEYPETLGMWADRLAYTVYLHVGAAKNWILQYALPPAVEAAGRTNRPDAPWPYLIERPNLVPGDSDADAILVHGFVNTVGRFEQLAVVFPPQFAQAKFVLGALQQWQFRPATQNGQMTAVEVLLIIPQEQE